MLFRSMKLLSCVQPDVAIFGQKDYQQWRIMERLVNQFALPLQIVGEPTCRAEDGLALSSRNAYLNPTERAQAAQLSTQLRQIAEALRSGATDTSTLEAQATQTLNDQGWKVDYVTVRRRMDLLPPAPGEALAGACVVLAAARMGQTRLIDNLEV